MSSFEPNNERKYVYLSKIGKIKKRMQIIVLEDKQSLMIAWWWAIIFMIWPILEAREEIKKYFRSFFGSNEDIQESFWNYLTFMFSNFLQRKLNAKYIKSTYWVLTLSQHHH